MVSTLSELKVIETGRSYAIAGCGLLTANCRLKTGIPLVSLSFLKHLKNIQLISAPSILGLKPTGVQNLPEGLLSNRLWEKLNCTDPVIKVPVMNNFYSEQRDNTTCLLNGEKLREFSLSLHDTITRVNNAGNFPLVLGGDCSILIGIMSALKKKKDHGLLFLDAHADFYAPCISITGEAADMDLAIVTGRGPDLLTNLHQLKPYVNDENVIHIGQRDWEETQQYGSEDIKRTSIQCFDWAFIKNNGTKRVKELVIPRIIDSAVNNFWIHFDTDVLSDDINPAVDYRLPGGLSFEEVKYLLRSFLQTGKIAGISVTIFNPTLDKDGSIGKNITSCLTQSFEKIE